MVPPIPVWDVCTLSTPKDLTAVYQSILTGLRTPAAPISHLEFSTECLTTCLCLGDKDLWVEYLESRILPPIFAGIPPIASISLRGTSGVAFPVGIFDSHAFRLVSSVEMTNCTFESPQAFRNLLKSFPMATTLVIDGLHWNNDETTPPYQLSNIGAPALTALRFRGITKRNFARTILSGGYLSNVVELLYYSHPDNSQRLAPLAELLVALGPNLGSLGLDILKFDFSLKEGLASLVKLHTLTLVISITPDLRDEDLLRRNHLKFLNILDFIDGPLLEEITFQTTCTDLKSFDCVAWLRFQEQFGRMDYNSPALPSMQTVRFVVSSSTLNDHRGERGVVYDERRFQDGRPVIGLWTCFFRGWASPVFVAALIGLVLAITNKFL